MNLVELESKVRKLAEADGITGVLITTRCEFWKFGCGEVSTEWTVYVGDGIGSVTAPTCDRVLALVRDKLQARNHGQSIGEAEMATAGD